MSAQSLGRCCFLFLQCAVGFGEHKRAPVTLPASSRSSTISYHSAFNELFIVSSCHIRLVSAVLEVRTALFENETCVLVAKLVESYFSAKEPILVLVREPRITNRNEFLCLRHLLIRYPADIATYCTQRSVCTGIASSCLLQHTRLYPWTLNGRKRSSMLHMRNHSLGWD